jgi:hypothetical protein
MFVGVMHQLAKFCGIQILTYALMSNHYHVLCEVPEPYAISDQELLNRIEALYGKARRDSIAHQLKKCLAQGGSSELAREIRDRFTRRICPLFPRCSRELRGHWASKGSFAFPRGRQCDLSPFGVRMVQHRRAVGRERLQESEILWAVCCGWWVAGGTGGESFTVGGGRGFEAVPEMEAECCSGSKADSVGDFIDRVVGRFETTLGHQHSLMNEPSVGRCAGFCHEASGKCSRRHCRFSCENLDG